MSFDDGTVMNESGGLRLKRLANAIPASYTVFKIGSTWYGEPNTADETPYADPDVDTVLSNVAGALAGGGKIHINHDGTITLDSNIDLYSDRLMLCGNGKSTILKMDDSRGAGEAAIVDVRGDYCTVSDLALDGNHANNGIASYGVLVYQHDQAIIENLYIKDLGSRGVQLEEADKCFLNNLFIDDVDNGAVGGVGICCDATGAGCFDNSASNIYISNTGEHGVKFYTPGARNRITNFVINTTGKEGLDFYGTDMQANNFYITGTGQNGILMEANNCVAANGTINTTASYYGVYMGAANNAVSNLSITGAGLGIRIGGSLNTVTGNSIAVTGARGIWLDDTDADYNTVVGNTIQDCAEGIDVVAGAQFNTIRGNTCQNNAVAPYDIDEPNNTFDARIISDAVTIDGATTIGVLSFKQAAWLAQAYLLYETAVANDTNVEVGYGDVGGADRDKYVASVTSGTGAIWETEALTLTATPDIGALDTVTFYQDGSGGAGEKIRLVIDVLYGVQ